MRGRQPSAFFIAAAIWVIRKISEATLTCGDSKKPLATLHNGWNPSISRRPRRRRTSRAAAPHQEEEDGRAVPMGSASRASALARRSTRAACSSAGASARTAAARGRCRAGTSRSARASRHAPRGVTGTGWPWTRRPSSLRASTTRSTPPRRLPPVVPFIWRRTDDEARKPRAPRVTGGWTWQRWGGRLARCARRCATCARAAQVPFTRTADSRRGRRRGPRWPSAALAITEGEGGGATRDTRRRCNFGRPYAQWRRAPIFLGGPSTPPGRGTNSRRRRHGVTCSPLPHCTHARDSSMNAHASYTVVAACLCF